VTRWDIGQVFEGVDMTQRIFLKGLESVHIKKYEPLNEKFDPNLHQALFEMPAGNLSLCVSIWPICGLCLNFCVQSAGEGEKGIVKAVIKSGYMIHDRVLRPAEVGVTK
jgi:molecular chaperone GrpE